ncbi:MAG: UDP-GlcNAc:undecaprenyl-phosphate GlcNAc-1-phosphate transferase, partial [Gammaproteobacteria bacterium]
DRSHIHHLLLDFGLSHMQATGLLVLVNIFFILLVIALQELGNHSLILLISVIASSLTYVLYSAVNRRKNQIKEQMNETPKKKERLKETAL